MEMISLGLNPRALFKTRNEFEVDVEHENKTGPGTSLLDKCQCYGFEPSEAHTYLPKSCEQIKTHKMLKMNAFLISTINIKSVRF